jgi:hypothetical protein
MKCSTCNHDIKTIGEMTKDVHRQRNDIPWYKLKREEPPKCPKCGTSLKLNVPKVIYIIFIAYITVGMLCVTLVFFASISWVWPLVIVYAAVGYPMWSLILKKLGELVLHDT